jgi:hypothetical protein
MHYQGQKQFAQSHRAAIHRLPAKLRKRFFPTFWVRLLQENAKWQNPQGGLMSGEVAKVQSEATGMKCSRGEDVQPVTPVGHNSNRTTGASIPMSLNPHPTARAMNPMSGCPMRSNAWAAFPMPRNPDPSAIPVSPETSNPNVCRTGSYSDNNFMPRPGWFGTDNDFPSRRRSHSLTNNDTSGITCGGKKRTHRRY